MGDYVRSEIKGLWAMLEKDLAGLCYFASWIDGRSGELRRAALRPCGISCQKRREFCPRCRKTGRFRWLPSWAPCRKDKAMHRISAAALIWALALIVSGCTVWFNRPKSGTETERALCRVGSAGLFQPSMSDTPDTAARLRAQISCYKAGCLG